MFSLREIREAATWSHFPEITLKKREFAIETIFEATRWCKIGEDDEHICNRVNNQMKEKFGGTWWSLIGRNGLLENAQNQKWIFIQLKKFNFLLFENPSFSLLMMEDERMDVYEWTTHGMTNQTCPTPTAPSLASTQMTQSWTYTPQPNYDIATNSDVMTCVICFTNERKLMITPCNHFVICEKCRNLIDKCPICRREISYFVTVYMS